MAAEGSENASATTTVTPRQAIRESFRDLKWVAFSIGVLTLIVLAIAMTYAIYLGAWAWPLPVLWAFGLWSAAAALGFLFGIPKVLQGSQPAKPPAGDTTKTGGAAPEATTSNTTLPAYQQRVNTNLEEISDWLTKIIVGVTLVQLKSLPPLADSLARRVTSGLPGGPHEGFGLAIIVTFGTLGFLFGYLVTRLYIQGALARAERSIAEPDDTTLAESPDRVLLAQMTEAVSRSRGGNLESMSGGRDSAAEEELRRLAADYVEINDPDWATRTRRRELAGAALTRAAVESGVSREELADQTDEALILALAGMVQAAPKRGDAALLLRAGPRVSRKHVQYWILQAVLRLLEARLMPAEDRKAVRRLLDQYEKTADGPLLKLIERVHDRLDAADAR